ncbi:ethyl tert-butyl ether degradation protein EthD, partial [Okeania hirsuta]
MKNLPDSPKGVVQTWDRGKQYQAWIELGFTAGSSLSSLFTSSPDLQRHISAVHAYPIREIYTIVFDGKPTLVGLRGYQAAQTIAEAGADFQKSKEVLKFT